MDSSSARVSVFAVVFGHKVDDDGGRIVTYIYRFKKIRLVLHRRQRRRTFELDAPSNVVDPLKQVRSGVLDNFTYQSSG